MRPPTARAVLAIAALLGVATLLATAPAQADEAPADDSQVTWSVQPSTPAGPDGRTRFDFAVDPGTTISDWVSVANWSTHEVSFQVYAADATTDYDTGAFTLIGADQASTDLGAWTSVDSATSVCAEGDTACLAGLGVTVTLAAGTSQDIPVTITVPHDATPGDHAAGIVASFRSEASDAQGSAVQVEQRVGTRIYLRVGGALAPAVGVSGVVAGYDGSANPVGTGTGTVGFDLTNTGNVRLDATPSVRLTGPFGLDLGTVTLDAVTDLVPGATTHVTAEVPGVPPLLLLTAEVTVTPVVAEADGAATAATGSARAWAVPWALLGLVALVVAGITLTLAQRRRARRLLAEELATYTEQVRAEALGLTSTLRPDVPNESETVR
ncbi:hypothetical protein CSO01_05140 [Cellulomonas soli]|uniref:DUF916 domain-containing protein n=1 Tax=Cellulomonas soli TaxID=931535 RepID=A0A512P9C0_9CELL|nr:hypothetical protein CSO01_05140 [Cellulomonas soli]